MPPAGRAPGTRPRPGRDGDGTGGPEPDRPGSGRTRPMPAPGIPAAGERRGVPGARPPAPAGSGAAAGPPFPGAGDNPPGDVVRAALLEPPPGGGQRLVGAAAPHPADASPFCHGLLQAGARHLAGEEGALAAFVRRHFPHLLDRRDRAAAALALEHAVCGWLPGAVGPGAEVRVRSAVEEAVRRAERLEEHWQARALAAFLPSGDAGAGFEQAEGRVEAERLIARAAVTPHERALLRRLAADDGGWSAVRRDLPPDLRATDEAFYRWQRAARQRWQRALARLVRPR